LKWLNGRVLQVKADDVNGRRNPTLPDLFYDLAGVSSTVIPTAGDQQDAKGQISFFTPHHWRAYESLQCF
jgi:hypothetical protein